MTRKFLTACVATLCISLQPLFAAQPAPARPKLIVMMVIDQFRSDFLTRFESRFLPARDSKGNLGGFSYLMNQGAYYPLGQFEILQSMTGPGHATVLTGAYPYQMGIPGNEWYDRSTHEGTYCAEDPSLATVGATARSSHVGTSPRNLIGTTVGDELKNAGFPSRVVSIALKDRASIFMGGHRSDLTLWFDTKAFQWVSSKFYLPDGKLPAWVVAENDELTKNRGRKVEWKLQGEGTGYSLADPKILRGGYNSEGIELGFPHSAEIGKAPVVNLPFGPEMTERLAEKAVLEYKLGQGKATDLLAVSFSSHDYLVHGFGLNSREAEELTVAEDRIFARFFNFLNKQVPGGLKNAVIVLTGDHGGPSNPDYLRDNRINAGRIDDESIEERVEGVLTAKFGKPVTGKWIGLFTEFGVSLDDRVIAEKKLQKSEVENVVRDSLLGLPEVAHVFTSTDYLRRILPPGIFEKQILRTYFPGRGADVTLIAKPFFIPGGATTTHVTGYSYDRSVPIILAGFGLKPGRYATPANVVDIAPTLSFLSGTVPPALSEGRVLSEAIASQPR